MRALEVVFVVQGEGRGHMTQALALAHHIRDAGHRVGRVLVGESRYRSVPSYFVDSIGASVEAFPAPTQVPNRQGRGVSVSATARDALLRLPAFLRSCRRIHDVTARADVVVNFLDFVGGVSRLLLRTRTPAVAVAHNYAFLHPALGNAPGSPVVKAFVLGYTRGAALRTSARAALSFGPLPGPNPVGLEVVPPLLRPGIRTLVPRDEGYLLAYALNAGYGDVLHDWQRRSPGTVVHCYLDGGSAGLAAPPGNGFYVHELSQEAFLRHLAGCRAYVGTAGFEAVCEAHYLGKPVLAVPTEGQYEQSLNAWDAQRVGAARAGGFEDLDAFWHAPPVPSRDSVLAFRRWVEEAPSALVSLIERVAASGSGHLPT